MPTSKNARLFYRAAKERFEDAELLLSMKRTTGAVYLAGYSVECMLKSLILSAVPQRREDEILATFRGQAAHDFRWLTRLYQQHGGVAIPQRFARHFRRVRNWSTGMRYSPSTIQQRQAKDFLASATEIINWADGRL
ncbi:MAG: HEPN domain-containing protein [Ardenticatenaceae bacterium]